MADIYVHVCVCVCVSRGGVWVACGGGNTCVHLDVHDSSLRSPLYVSWACLCINILVLRHSS
jgi:hypothetical protein